MLLFAFIVWYVPQFEVQSGNAELVTSKHRISSIICDGLQFQSTVPTDLITDLEVVHDGVLQSV